MSDREFIAVFHYDNGGTNRCGAEPYRYAEEIVRCKECKYFGNFNVRTVCVRFLSDVTFDDFSSYGERKTDE